MQKYVDESPNFVATYQSFAEESQLGYMFRRRRRRCRTPHETADRPSTRRRPVGAERAERAGGRAGGQVSPPSLVLLRRPDTLLRRDPLLEIVC